LDSVTTSCRGRMGEFVGVEEEMRALRAREKDKEAHRLSSRIEAEIKGFKPLLDEAMRWEKGFCLINPFSQFMQAWDVVLIVGLLYTSIVTPFDASFLNPVLWNTIFFLNLIVDLAFFFDIVITFNLPYLDPVTGLWIRSHVLIARQYLRGWFAIDVLSIFPFDYILQAAYGDNIDSQALRAFRLLKLLKLARIIRGNRIWKRWKDRVGLNLTKLYMVFFIFLTLLIAHWFACILGVIPYVEGNPNVNWQIAYFDGLGIDFDTLEVGTIYLASFYWSVMTITTIGFGDVSPQTDMERGFITFLMLFGASLQAYLIGAICGLVAELASRSTENRIAMNSLNEFMRTYDFPYEMRIRLRKYFSYAHSVKDAGRYKDLIEMMSPNLQDEVNLLVNAVWVKEVPFVQLSPASELGGFVSALSRDLTVEIYAPFERVVSIGEDVNKLYIISKGIVVLHVNSTPFDDAEEETHGNLSVRMSVSESIREELIRGQCFGYELIYTNYKALYNASTLQFSEVHVLKKPELDRILNRFPETKKRIEEDTRDREEHLRRLQSDASYEL